VVCWRSWCWALHGAISTRVVCLVQGRLLYTRETNFLHIRQYRCLLDTMWAPRVRGYFPALPNMKDVTLALAPSQLQQRARSTATTLGDYQAEPLRPTSGPSKASGYSLKPSGRSAARSVIVLSGTAAGKTGPASSWKSLHAHCTTHVGPMVGSMEDKCEASTSSPRLASRMKGTSRRGERASVASNRLGDCPRPGGCMASDSNVQIKLVPKTSDPRMKLIAYSPPQGCARRHVHGPCKAGAC